MKKISKNIKRMNKCSRSTYLESMCKIILLNGQLMNKRYNKFCREFDSEKIDENKSMKTDLRNLTDLLFIEDNRNGI